jgi:periplasmic protein TonB
VTDIKFPLTLSVVGHAVILACLVFFLSGKILLPLEPVAKGGIEVAFEPALPKSETAPLPSPPAEAPTPEPPPEAAVPPPEPPVTPPEPAPAVVSEPTPPVPEASVTASEPSPPPKPVVKKAPKPVPRPREAPLQTQAYLPNTPPPMPAAPAAPPQTATATTPAPAPVPSPEASAGYQALLRAWLEGHKRYPDAARERGEEGRAVLRFEVDRSGRVLDYAVTSSTGYSDLDQSIDEMMRGADLPPFPPGMPQPRMQVSVTIRFSLRR